MTTSEKRYFMVSDGRPIPGATDAWAWGEYLQEEPDSGQGDEDEPGQDNEVDSGPGEPEKKENGGLQPTACSG